MKNVPVLGEKAIKGPLAQEHDSEGNDYVMLDVEKTAWITAGNISIYIRKSFEGVSVELYPHKGETGESFSSCHMTYDDAHNMLEEEEDD